MKICFCNQITGSRIRGFVDKHSPYCRDCDWYFISEIQDALQYNIIVRKLLKKYDYVAMLYNGIFLYPQLEQTRAVIVANRSPYFTLGVSKSELLWPLKKCSLGQEIVEGRKTVVRKNLFSIVYSRQYDILLSPCLSLYTAQCNLLTMLGVPGWWRGAQGTSSKYYGEVHSAGWYTSLTDT